MLSGAAIIVLAPDPDKQALRRNARRNACQQQRDVRSCRSMYQYYALSAVLLTVALAAYSRLVIMPSLALFS